MTTGALPALPTISGSVAQSEEQPVVCGKAEGASPFGSAIFSECSSVFRAPGLGPGGRGWKSCRSDHFELLPWSNTSGIRLLSGTMQVEILPAAPLPGGVKVARRPVKPFGVGASPTLAANFSGCNVSSRRPRSERGGRRCNSCHPDHFTEGRQI